MIKSIANKLGGKCLSKKYAGSQSYLKFICKRKHKFDRNWYQMKFKGRWCISCKAIEGKYPEIPISSL